MCAAWRCLKLVQITCEFTRTLYFQVCLDLHGPPYLLKLKHLYLTLAWTAWLTHRLSHHLEHHADRQGVILKQWQGSWSKGKPGMTHKRRNIIKSTTFVLWDFQTKSTTRSMSMCRKRTRCIFCGHANGLGIAFSWWNKRSVQVAQQPPQRVVGCPKHIASKGNDPKVFGDLPDRPSWEGSTRKKRLPSPTLQAWCSKVDLQSYQILTWN